MKIIALLSLFLPLICFSQDIRFLYNYQFVSDTLKKDVITKEIVILDFYGKEQRSVFTGLKNIISDSTMAENSKKGIMAFPDSSMKIAYIVEKITNRNLMYLYTPDHMVSPPVKVKDDTKINWKISNEQKNLLGYSAQKATTFFAGRKWTAWFTSEISIPDGPYKFYGLPGLILKISDKTETHSFEIVSVKNQKSHYSILNENAYKEAKQITSQEYRKIPNPSEQYKRQALMGDVIFRSIDEKQKFLKDIDDKIKERKIHDNNPIELDYTQ